MQTPLEVLYQSVWWSSLLWSVGISVVGGLIFIFVLSMLFEKMRVGGCVTATVVGVIVVLIVGIPGSLLIAGARATDATTSAWEQAKKDKVTYIEKLHGVWVAYEEVTYTCNYDKTSIQDGGAGTNCQYVSEKKTCLHRDKDGDCDDYSYEYTPWFAYERTLSATMDVYQNGTTIFASHLAPEDWSHNTYRGRSISKSAGFEHTTNPDWLRVKRAIDARLALPGTVYHPYMNYVNADDQSLFRDYGGHIPDFKKLGLLPTINKIHDGSGRKIESDIHNNVTGPGFDYEVVQFVGGMTLSSREAQYWQEVAGLWAAMAGPKMQASLMLVFAPASFVAEPYQWVKTSRAYLQQEDIFGRYILPKNLILVMCGVTGETISWCQMDTGMFKGNEGVVQAIAGLQPFPFTPEALFGKVSASLVSGSTGLFSQITFEQGVVDMVLRDPQTGFRRVKMADAEYIMLTIQPDPEQIDQIKNSETVSAVTTMAIVWGVLLALAGAGLKSQS